MCLKPMSIPPIPEQTASVVQAVFLKGNVYVQICDAFDGIYSDDVFADLYPMDGQPALAP